MEFPISATGCDFHGCLRTEEDGACTLDVCPQRKTAEIARKQEEAAEQRRRNSLREQGIPLPFFA